MNEVGYKSSVSLDSRKADHYANNVSGNIVELSDSVNETERHVMEILELLDPILTNGLTSGNIERVKEEANTKLAKSIRGITEVSSNINSKLAELKSRIAL